MTESREKIRAKLFERFMENVTDLGWNRISLERAALDLGLEAAMAHLMFPGGVAEIVDYFAGWSDQQLHKAIELENLGKLRVREKIYTCVKLRLEVNNKYREAIRGLLSYLILPQNATLGMRLAWRTASEIWYLSGDTSTDWNYYTKRGLLVSVYSTTLMYWLSDNPDEDGDYPKTWEFLNRRISDVLNTFSFPRKIREFLIDGGCISESKANEEKQI